MSPSVPAAHIIPALASDEKGFHISEDYVLSGHRVKIDDIISVARNHRNVVLTTSPEVLERVAASRAFIDEAVENKKPIYGVTTLFGAMANKVVSPENATELQNVAIRHLRTGAGKYLPLEDVRAAMVLRANSLMQGVSGIRLEIIQRFVQFLNHNITPLVREFGSIGASGDLVPLAAIASCLIGYDESCRVDFAGEEMDAPQALAKIGLKPIRLLPKEGLALFNGTSVMNGIAVNCVGEARKLFALAMVTHALFAQGLLASIQPYHPFVHGLKPHPGQEWAASTMLKLLDKSGLIRDEVNGKHGRLKHELIQDRYSLRCLPQYIGPIYDGIQQVANQMEIEASSVSDNPLIDVANNRVYHCGNFLGQYVGVGMDQLRYYLSLIVKHLDTQIALLVSPEFSNGLPSSLVGNTECQTNLGLKGLQISANSMAPLLEFYGNSIADRFPTHAEQFNQNINSQGFGSANLTRKALDVMQHYIAAALIFGIQAVDLRTKQLYGHYDASQVLSRRTKILYDAVREVINCNSSEDRPFLWNDCDHFLDLHQAQIAENIASDGIIARSVSDTLHSFL